jgi:hypothetical protein
MRADQRFYASTYGRFNTPDQFKASAGPSDPGSWNRYSYVLGDPINLRDPNGTCAEDTDTSANVCDTADSDVAYGYASTVSPQSYYTLFGRDRAYLIHAGGMLMSREAISPKCLGGMSALGVDFDVLAIAAGTVDIQNGTSDKASMASAYGNAQLGAAAQAQYDDQYAGYLQARGEQHLTVADFFAVTGNTARLDASWRNTVYINPSLLGTNILNVDQGLMLHEMLHDVYGLDDKAIMNTLKGYDPKAGIDPDGVSRQITDWMVKNCVTGKGNN